MSTERVSLVIGVAGGTGSGKTTIVQRVKDALGAGAVTVLEQDRYYRDLSALPADVRGVRNFDHPDAVDFELLIAHVTALSRHETVGVPRYDFHRHVRMADVETLAPRPTLIVEGILILSDARLRRLCDVKVFVDTADDIRFIRRLQRDLAERGRDVDGVIAQYHATVRPMHLEFVEPSKRHADIIVPEGGHNAVAMEMLLGVVSRYERRADLRPGSD